MTPNSSTKTLLLLIVIVLIFNSCSEENDETFYDFTGNWKVAYFLDNGKKITKTQDNTWSDRNNGDITAIFSSSDAEGKGTVSGIRVSNGYSGNYTIYDDGKISFTQVIQTEINEPKWTDLFNLEMVENYQIESSILLLSSNNKERIIAFERN
jgi:hypothetical protein